MPGLFDFSQPALGLADQPQGILSGFSDPKTAALLSMAGALLQAGGPSPRPVSLGQALGAGVNSGLNTFNTVQHSSLQNAVLGQQLKKAQLENQLTESLSRGGLGGQMTPDQLEAYGQRLAAAGHPGGAGLIAAAEKLRTQQQNALTVQGFRSAPGTLGAGVTTTSPQGKALLGNLTGDRSFDESVLAAQNEALNSNARPTMPAQPVAAPNPGLFGSLSNSPFVGPSAAALQRMVDTAPPQGLNPQNLLTQYTQLSQQHNTAADRVLARQENADLRRELAGEAQQTRRDLAAATRASSEGRQRDLTDQRNLRNEALISGQYNGNPTVKEFLRINPLITSTTKYVAGKKYDSSGDRALVMAFAKLNDPSDRVSEGDLRNIDKLGALVPERFIQSIQNVFTGKELPDRVRQEMFNVMRSKFEALNEQQAQIEDEYADRAKRYMLDPRNVVQFYAHRREPAGRGGGSGSGVIDFSQLPKRR